MSTYDTLIIGAGMSGLAAGIRLAYFDQKVCICERHNTIGGLNSFYRLRGRDFDVGLHAALCELCWLQHMSRQLDSPSRFNHEALRGKSQAFLQN
jgi:phytoene dehydrogenase-like protein